MICLDAATRKRGLILAMKDLSIDRHVAYVAALVRGGGFKEIERSSYPT
jgi:hypothetical protein